MVPLRLVIGLVCAALVLLAFSLASDTDPWPDGVATTGRVVSIQDRWSKSGGSALIWYEVDGTSYERWLPDVADHGRLSAGDPYLLEYRADDPTDARGVAANRDDVVFARHARWAGIVVLAVAVLLVRLLWREEPPRSSPRRERREDS